MFDSGWFFFNCTVKTLKIFALFKLKKALTLQPKYIKTEAIVDNSIGVILVFLLTTLTDKLTKNFLNNLSSVRKFLGKNSVM